MKNKFKKILSLLVCLMLAASLFSCGSPSLEAENSAPKEPPKAPDPVTINMTVAVCGDIMGHSTQIDAALQPDGTYDFNDNYDYVRGYMSDADICLANIETTFPGDGNYTGYPAFDSPDSMAEAIANAGVDVAMTANNHTLDKQLAGALRTVQVLRDNGMYTCGTRLDDSENRSLIVPVTVTDENGEEQLVKLGLVVFTYETGTINGRRTLNGNYLEEGALDCINSFRISSGDEALAQDIQTIKNEISWCKNRADVTILYVHWGEEYQLSANPFQKFMAAELAETNVDAIVASHPHVIQEIEILTSGSGKEIPVYYSIGNYISNQRSESLSGYTNAAHNTEQELIAHLTFTLTKKVEMMTVTEDMEIDTVTWSDWLCEGFSAKAIPCWVERYKPADKIKYAIIPLTEGYENNPELLASGHLSRAESALKEITETLGEEYIWNLK